MEISITTDELRQIFECLIQRMGNDEIQSIDIGTDYYWLVSTSEWDDFSKTPEEISVGSLVDDWNSLKSILETKRIVSYVDYDRFASVLRAISEKISPSA